VVNCDKLGSTSSPAAPSSHQGLFPNDQHCLLWSRVHGMVPMNHHRPPSDWCCVIFIATVTLDPPITSTHSPQVPPSHSPPCSTCTQEMALDIRRGCPPVNNDQSPTGQWCTSSGASSMQDPWLLHTGSPHSCVQRSLPNKPAAMQWCLDAKIPIVDDPGDTHRRGQSPKPMGGQTNPARTLRSSHKRELDQPQQHQQCPHISFWLPPRLHLPCFVNTMQVVVNDNVDKNSSRIVLPTMLSWPDRGVHGQVVPIPSSVSSHLSTRSANCHVLKSFQWQKLQMELLQSNGSHRILVMINSLLCHTP